MEKRQYPRVEVSLPMQYKELHGSSYLSQGTLTKNLSEGGVRFNTTKFVSLACRLIVEIALPSVSKPIKAISKTVWIKKLNNEENYEVGNQFIALGNEDEALLSDCIKTLLEDTPKD